MWFREEFFKTVVDQAWNIEPKQDLVGKIKHFKDDIKQWSKKKIGNT